MIQVVDGVRYARETLTPEFAHELMPMLVAHFLEIDPFQDEPLDPDWEQYYRAQSAGGLYAFTARDADGVLVGYMVAFAMNDPHHRTVKKATQDIFYISKDKRGFGLHFLMWCNEQLKAEGVKTDFQHITERFDWSPMAARAGYHKVETVWAKVL